MNNDADIGDCDDDNDKDDAEDEVESDSDDSWTASNWHAWASFSFALAHKETNTDNNKPKNT